MTTPADQPRPTPVAGFSNEPPEPGLNELTDLCVKCGLCLPHCPTYALSRREGDSPRGRIALIQGLVDRQLKVTDALAQHLDGCLTCRSCETVCPAKVPYGEIIDRGRAVLRTKRPPAPAIRLLVRLAGHPELTRWAPPLLGLARTLGLARLARRLMPRHWLGRSLTLRPDRGPAVVSGSRHEPVAPERGAVSLFTGCVARGLDRATQADSIAALTRLGYRVHVPAGQGCCGALALHEGMIPEARSAALANVRAFAADRRPVVTAATGCSLALAEYDRLIGEDGAALAARVVDVNRFLASASPDTVGTPTPQRVAVHIPCSARLAPGAGEDAVRLLRRVAGVEPVVLGSARCCGAAGHHFLTRGPQADALRRPLLEEIESLSPDYVVSPNPGCALHLSAGLAAKGLGPVDHPVSLFARAQAQG